MTGASAVSPSMKQPLPATSEEGLKMERVIRFELTTATLATWGSTTELHPHRALVRAPAP